MVDSRVKSALESRTNPNPARKINIETYSGDPIPNWIDIDPTEDAINAQRHFLGVQKLIKNGAIPYGPATGRYNCFGHVFGNRRTCIPPPNMPESVDIDELLTSDLYERVKSPPQVGDIVAYRHPSLGIQHVGYVSRIDQLKGIIVLSKWGALEEYEHHIMTSPYDNYEIEYWRLMQ